MENQSILILLVFAAGLLFGMLVIYLVLNARLKSVNEEHTKALEAQKTLDSERQVALQQLAAAQTQDTELRNQLTDWKDRADQHARQLTETRTQLATSKQESDHLAQRLSEERQRIAEMETKLRTDFENLANRIMDEKSKRFTEMNSEKLGEIIRPFREKIQEFETKVESANKEQNEGRAALFQQLKNLEELNKNISQEALNLTQALRGDNKIQGDWGEMILERILESSGLIRGTHYSTQESFSEEAGRKRPDVILYLPEKKHLIIDSKVSLKAFTDWIAETDEPARLNLAKTHALSIRKHMQDLAAKDYAGIAGLSTPDFVLMFVPNDAAYMLAMQQDGKLYEDAYKRKITLVGPSTLMAVMMTIEHLWKQEQQRKNVDEVIGLGTKILDKISGVIEAVDELGKHLDKAEKAYDTVKTRLSTGRGNLLRQAEKMRTLGIRSTKSLPAGWQADDDDDEDMPNSESSESAAD